MKNILLIILTCATLTCFAANDDDPKVEKLKKQELALIKEQKELAKKMFDLRVKLLTKDPELKKLYEKIMELHKELALQIDSKKEMRKLLIKMKAVRTKLFDIKEKQAKE